MVGGGGATDVRTLRKRLGLSRAALAELSGVGAGKLGRIERGEREMDVEVARAVAPHLGVGVRVALYGQEEMPPLGLDERLTGPLATAKGSPASGPITVDPRRVGALRPREG